MTAFSGFIILLGVTFSSIIKDAFTHDVSGFIKCPDSDDDSDWVLGENDPYVCYLLTPNKQSWEDSKQYCSSQGAELVGIRMAAENEFVRRFHDLVPNEHHIWIGLFSDLPLSNPLTAGYKLINNQVPSYTNWARWEPNNWRGTGESVVDMVKDGKWNDNSPSRLYYGVCKKFMTVPVVCDSKTPSDGWFLGPSISNSCFQTLPVPQNRSSAESQCKDKGGYLATIHSREEEKFVSIMSAVKLSILPVWTGFQVQGMWSDGSDEVFSIAGKGQCAIYDVKRSELKFTECANNNVAICKKTVPPSKSFTKCPGEPDGSPWELGPYKNSCYRVTDTEQDWESAKQFCESEGASLALILSHGENNFALSLTNKNIKSLWIGLSYVNDQFEYVDGAPLRFTDKWFFNGNPLFNEPNGRKDPGAENCVRMIGINNGAAAGYWKDDKCSKKAYGVCQRDAPPGA